MASQASGGAVCASVVTASSRLVVIVSSLPVWIWHPDRRRQATLRHRANSQFRDRAMWMILCSGLPSEAVLVGVRGGLGPRRQSQLGEDVADVSRNRLLADEELGRDRAVGLASGHQREHLAFAPAQPSWPCRPRQ